VVGTGRSAILIMNDDYDDDDDDDDDDEYRTCLYNLVVHPPALAICVHLLSPAGFPAGPMNRLHYNGRHRSNACSSPGQIESTACVSQRSYSPLSSFRLPYISAQGGNANPQHVYHS
jgi:hypothetical protein